MKSEFIIENPPTNEKLLSFSESPSPMWNFISDKKNEEHQDKYPVNIIPS